MAIHSSILVWKIPWTEETGGVAELDTTEWTTYAYLPLYSSFSKCFRYSRSFAFPWASLVAQMVKHLPAMRETWVQSLRLGRSPGEGKGYPLQYSGLENSMACIVYGVAKSRTWLSSFHTQARRATYAQQTRTSHWLSGRGFKGKIRGVCCRACDQFVHNSLTDWWRGDRIMIWNVLESQSPTFWFQPLWGLHADDLHEVHFSHLVWALVFTK